jgi:hypothetical protein
MKFEAGSGFGNIVGFNDDLFWGHGEVYEDGRLFMHYISSRYPNQGNVQQLFSNIIEMGFDLHVVRPIDTMQHICGKFNLCSHNHFIDGYHSDVDVWYKGPCRQHYNEDDL